MVALLAARFTETRRRSRSSRFASLKAVAPHNSGAAPSTLNTCAKSLDSFTTLTNVTWKMSVERKLNPSAGTVELWRCQWDTQEGAKPHKAYLEKICDEQNVPVVPHGDPKEVSAICWSSGRTLGNVAVRSQRLLLLFPGEAGEDVQLPCDFVNAGKFRHGADRWWCQTHQTHWGTKADHESFAKLSLMRCANHTQAMSYVVGPVTINLNEHAEVGVWCSMPAAISTEPIRARPPRLHVHLRSDPAGKKTIDRDFGALSVLYSDKLDLFGSKEITRVNLTPPAAFEFACGLELKREMSCINCSHCREPHLDLGDFGRTPHRKHFCANCGRDSTWSTRPIISTPLQPLHDQFARFVSYETPNRELNLDDYKHCTYTIWASTPAVIWTAQRPQEVGIHVHVHEKANRIIDDTFGSVILNGKAIERPSLIRSMIARSVV